MARRRRWARTSLVPVLLAAALLGCSVLVDTSDLAGPPLGAGVDAAADARVDATDAAPDAFLPDANVDASACAGTFCDDFDHDGGFDRWDQQQLASEGSLRLSTENVVSPPHALRATLVRTTDEGQDHIAFLHKKLKRGASIACEVDVKLVTTPSSRWIDVLRFETEGPGLDRYWLWYGIRDTLVGMFREDFFKTDTTCECPRQDLSPGVVVVGKWTHIKMVTDFRTARVEQDGVVVSAGSFGGFTPTDDFTVSLGAFSAGYVAGAVEVDNLVCTVTPP